MMNKNKLAIALLTGLTISLSSCGDDDGGKPDISVPDTYAFKRDGSSTVSFSGQTTRIAMAEEILSAFMVETNTEAIIDGMFAHEEGNANFSNADLNASDKNVRSKTAASADYFSANTVLAAEIKEDFDGWIAAQVSEVFPSWEMEASAGVAGKIEQAGGGSTRYVNAKGLELNQAFAKGLIGALMTDQILNNYVSEAVLDAGENVPNNDAGIVEEGENYTSMEHKWDEAYGYLYGAAANGADPRSTVGSDDSFLNKYLGSVNSDEDFAGIADEVFDAFKLGRAAIVAGDYDLRDVQADIIRANLSKVIAVRSVYYLEAGAAGLGEANPDMASIFHSLSEAYGFIYSLQFTRNPNTDAPYFTRAEVEAFLTDSMDDGDNGLWDVEASTLTSISSQIAEEFDFTVAEARN
ncbi:MAG: DUF4856 domain-containing protein [Ekhidna sp.]